MLKDIVQQRIVGHDFVDHVDFEEHLDRLYDLEPEDFTPADNKFLAQVFAMLALGRRFSPMSDVDQVDEAEQLVRLKG